MKRFLPLVLFGMLATGNSAATASSWSLNEFKPRVMPVLVQVDSHGKVTDASPANELSPRFDRLLRENLDQMITKPATDRHGRPISSQFIINLSLETTPRPEGDYYARFTYVSSKPVPSGSWYWVHIDGHRLALADRNSFRRTEHFHYNDNRPAYQPAYNRSYSSPTPPVQNTSQNASRSAPASATAHGR